jgi:hypothetical protein
MQRLSIRPGLILSRRVRQNAEPAVLWDIESDPAPAGTKLIAEAGRGGLYQGSFIGDSWKSERSVSR